MMASSMICSPAFSHRTTSRRFGDVAVHASRTDRAIEACGTLLVTDIAHTAVDLGRVDIGPVAGDDAALFQPPHPLLRRRGGKPHLASKVGERHTAIA